jgi:predicted DNA-binding transcriptional regulator YafY
MPANKYALLRYRIIDRYLTNSAKAYPSKEDLREACEESLYGSIGEHISISTIEKDLWAMRNESDLGYYAPIEYDKTEKGYFYSEEGYTIQDISLSDGELEAIQLAANTLNQFRHIPIFSDYEQAIDKILNRLTISPQMDDDNRPIIQFESSPSSEGQEHLATLLKAIQGRFCIQIGYQKFSGTTSKTYAVNPYLLKEYRNRWYLIAHEKKRNDYLTFGLDRIVSLEITDERYEADEDFDSDRFFMHSIGITEHGNSPQKVLIRLGKVQGQYLLTQPLHHSQKLAQQNADYFTFEYHVLITHELLQFILGLGSEALVLEPLELREKIIAEIQLAQSNYTT